MKCDSKTMLKAAAGLGVAIAIAYFTLPAARAFILASAPIALVLICPLSMVFMMYAMNGSKKDAGAKPTVSSAPSAVNDGGLGQDRRAPGLGVPSQPGASA